MDYQKLYQEKLTTPENAVKVVQSGDWVDYGWCTNHPVALDRALAARKDELRDVKVRGGVTMWMPEICKAEDAGEHFTWHAWHMSGVDRKIAAKGMGYFILTHCAPTSIALQFSRHNVADHLTDFLQEVKDRAQYNYWLFGHYHDNKAIDTRHILLWEQIVQIL